MNEQQKTSDENTDLEKSKELAQWIEIIKGYFPFIDIDHARKMVEEMKSAAHRQVSVSALVIGYDSAKTEHLFVQAEAMEAFIKFYDKLIEANQLKEKVIANKEAQIQMNRSLGYIDFL